MDRTHEFRKIMDGCDIPQMAAPSSRHATSNILDELERIRRSVTILKNSGHVEGLTTDKRIDDVRDSLHNVKDMISGLETRSENSSEGLHLGKMKEILTGRCNRLSLEYAVACKKKRGRRPEFATRLSANPMALLVEEEQKTRQESATASGLAGYYKMAEMKSSLATDEIKRRILCQIDELGQMVSEIGIHVNLQGERIRRIDDVITRSEGLVRGGYMEALKTWENVDCRTKRIVKFFLFWIVIILVVWAVWR